MSSRDAHSDGLSSTVFLQDLHTVDRLNGETRRIGSDKSEGRQREKISFKISGSKSWNMLVGEGVGLEVARARLAVVAIRSIT